MGLVVGAIIGGVVIAFALGVIVWSMCFKARKLSDLSEIHPQASCEIISVISEAELHGQFEKKVGG